MKLSTSGGISGPTAGEHLSVGQPREELAVGVGTMEVLEDIANVELGLSACFGGKGESRVSRFLLYQPLRSIGLVE